MPGLRRREPAKETAQNAAIASAFDRDRVALGKTSKLVYTPAKVPDYGRWPDFVRARARGPKCGEYMARWHHEHQREIERRRALYGRVHRIDDDNSCSVGVGLLTVCLLKYDGCDFSAETAARIAAITDDADDLERRNDVDVFASARLVDVTCGDCLAIVAHLRAAEKMRRGMR